MEVYPATPAPSKGIITEAIFRTGLGKGDSGREYRKSKSPYATYNVTVAYNALLLANINILWKFYLNRKGAFEAFWFYGLEVDEHINLYVGTGDGSEDTFDLPGKNTSGQVIYANGVVVAAADYTVLAGGGDGSSDRVQFDSPPTAGYEISCDLTGYMRIPCRYKEDKMSRERFVRLLYKTGIDLLGLSFDAL